ncbi:hypothetical protein FJ930_16590 [Mesorhizobium sp. B2-4-15]|uniref:hypothetical protein n=1 Tax=Mesorhizobium sp. B2-4-15 TaxID=2589934 RepID=UPI001154A7D9|nr:hypothetical protein [Mesorhizobium sp. B2-4-15]TPK70796.1 hypothetical protein FJ930_16590 [Mesorhizobium sp. B2-4-15]
MIEKVVVNAQYVTVELSIVGVLKTLNLNSDELDAVSAPQAISIPIAVRRRGIETPLMLNNEIASQQRAPDTGLINLLRRAQRLLGLLTDGSNLTMADLADRERMNISDLSRVLRFAFLAPDISQAIIEGRQPTELTSKRLFRLSELPNAWDQQRTLLLTHHLTDRVKTVRPAKGTVETSRGNPLNL